MCWSVVVTIQFLNNKKNVSINKRNHRYFAYAFKRTYSTFTLICIIVCTLLPTFNTKTILITHGFKQWLKTTCLVKSNYISPSVHTTYPTVFILHIPQCPYYISPSVHTTYPTLSILHIPQCPHYISPKLTTILTGRVIRSRTRVFIETVIL